MSGVTDLFGNAEDRPELVTTIYKELIPDFESAAMTRCASVPLLNGRTKSTFPS